MNETSSTGTASLSVESIRKALAEVGRLEREEPAQLILHSLYVREIEKTLGPISEWPLFYLPDGQGGMRLARAFENKWIAPGSAHLMERPAGVIPVSRGIQ